MGDWNLKETFVGIDLGTVNSCLAFTDGNGKVEVMLDETGMGLTPSVILFNGGEKIVGNRAKSVVTPENKKYYASAFKKQIGTQIKKNYLGVDYKASELSAMVIKKLLTCFKRKYGRDVLQAVITVPGDFDDNERNDTMNAGYIAGLRNVVILNEPVAAALSYFAGNKYMDNKTLLVYDLGGGTLDINLFRIEDGDVRILSNTGDRNLGGRDWDLDLVTLIQSKVIKATGMTFEELSQYDDFAAQLRFDAQAIKERLYFAEGYSDTMTIGDREVPYTITREEYETATQYLANETLKYVKRAIGNAKIKERDIDSFILVGGAVKMPQIMNTLKATFPKNEIVLFDPELAVAKGAAIYAESIFKNGDPTINTVSTKSIGIIAGIDGEEKICNAIFKDTELPIHTSLNFRPKRDDQKYLELDFYESIVTKGHKYIDVDRGKFFSKFVLELKGHISRGRTKFVIDFDADTNGSLTVMIRYNKEAVFYDLSEKIKLTNEELVKSMTKLEGVA